MIHVITKRIAKERPRLPIFTIHDSIVTTIGNEDYVEAVLKEELEKAIGIPAHCKREYWKPENMKFNDGVKFLN